jgi:hypothetical protein
MLLHRLQDVRLLLSRGVSEVHREAAALKEQKLVLKLEAGKLTRAELLMRQKVCFLSSGLWQKAPRRVAKSATPHDACTGRATQCRTVFVMCSPTLPCTAPNCYLRSSAVPLK